MLMGTADVVGRYFFNHPVTGAFEISEVMLAGIVFFSLAYTSSQGGHVRVDTFVVRFPPGLRAVLGFLVALISMVVFALIGWQGLLNAVSSWETKQVVDVIDIPLVPFKLFVPLGCLAICLELAKQAMGYLSGQARE